MLASRPRLFALALIVGALPQPRRVKNCDSHGFNEWSGLLTISIVHGTDGPVDPSQSDVAPTLSSGATVQGLYVVPSSFGHGIPSARPDRSHDRHGQPSQGNSQIESVQTTSLPTTIEAASQSSPSQIQGQSRFASRFSRVTIVDHELQVHTVTVTEVESTQVPNVTSAVRNHPDTSGTVITVLETEGRTSVQPFVTSIPSMSQATLQPLNTTLLLENATNTHPLSTLTETVTLPLTTFETVQVTQTVTTLPVESISTFTTVVLLNTTVTTNGTTITSSVLGSSTDLSTATLLTETTLEASSTLTGTIATTITATGTALDLPTSSPTTCYLSNGCTGQDLFQAVAVVQPPSNIQQRSGHPVPRLGINNMTGPIETNKFYANFFLGTQGSPSFVMPYSLSWSKGSGNAQSWGMAISHIDDDQKVFGPPNTQIPNSPASYYINPLGIQSIIMSAAELSSTTVMTSDSLFAFSANIHLSPSSGSSSSITFPVVQGMGFVTGLYINLQPAIQSSVFFRTVESVNSPKPGIYKYRITLEDDKIWLLYAVSDFGVNPNLQLTSSTVLQGLPNWSGMIQIAKNPGNGSESIYDNAAGVYAKSGSVSGFAQGSEAQYGLSWGKGGAFASNTTLLMYALPHHLQSFDSSTNGKVTSLKLATTTKGTATAVVADAWTLQETLPIDLGFAPWRPSGGQQVSTLSSSTLNIVQNIAATEASQNMSAQTNLNSMYYSGKGLSKFAQIVYTMNDLTEQKSLAAAALVELKESFAVFTNNQQQFPLLYDTDWKGMVSSASYVTGDSGVDFGNSYYNDHHFHYGYFIHAAAVIGYLDPTWLVQNKDFVNALVRDVSNPSSLDQYFPVFRSFDWYHGHSWAKGLYESGDGKDEESSSEDSMFAYALKMWGKTIGDPSMEARGNLMLAVQSRSLQNYFLLQSDNVNQPAEFIGNKVTGIIFENKVDHTTYFGTNFEYIQGIHMIPVMPFSTLTRTQQFVSEEWATYFADGAIDPASNVQGGWKGILYANFAIINPTAAYGFFTQANYDPSWLDGGASLTWYIVLSAMLGGSS